MHLSILVVASFLSLVGCADDAESSAGTGGGTAVFDPGFCTFRVTGTVQEDVAVQARGITEYDGRDLLILECAVDAMRLQNRRLRVELPDYAGPGTYTIDATTDHGQVTWTSVDESVFARNWPGAPEAACTVEVTSDVDGVVSGTFGCTGLTTEYGNGLSLESGAFEMHGVPSNMWLIPT